MKTITVGRLLLSKTLAFNCQITCALVVILLLADHARASALTSEIIPANSEYIIMNPLAEKT